MFEKEREIAQLLVQHWTSNEVFSFGWFFMIGILIIAYTVWIKLLDRSRATELLLLGSLEAVAKVILAILLGNLLGLYNYKVRLLPMPSNVFATSVTISPIIIMLVQQYTTSWKGYIFWITIGNAFLNLVIFPIYTAIGIIEFHKWNVFYHFLVLLSIAICMRIIFLWITGTQKRHSGGVS
jgi:hypothetical protein